jgi:hypothetical protein
MLKYLLGWDVTIRQFLPFHLIAVIPGVLLKYGYGYYERFIIREKQDK